MSDRDSGDNPYAAPGIRDDGADGSTEAPSPPARSFRPLAVIVGVMVDIGLTFAVIIALQIWLTTRDGGMSAVEAQRFFDSSQWTLILLPFGLGCSVIGGFLTGAMARIHEHRHALANALLSIAIVFLIPGDESWDEPIGLEILSRHGYLGAIFAGAELARRRRHRRARRMA